MQNIRFEIVWVNPKDLIPYEKNAKIHSQKQIEDIAGQIAEVGFDQPIVVDKYWVIIKGHARRLAAMFLGLKEVPVIVSTISEYQAIAARIADNKVAEAPWDPQLLKFDMGTLQRIEHRMELTGFTAPKIEELLNPFTDESAQRNENDPRDRKEDDEIAEVRQIILVTDPQNFERLMNQFAQAQKDFNVNTNIAVIEKLFEIYDQTRNQQQAG